MNKKEVQTDLKDFYEQLYAQAAPPKENSLDSRKVVAILNKVRCLKHREKSAAKARAATSTGLSKDRIPKTSQNHRKEEDEYAKKIKDTYFYKSQGLTPDGLNSGGGTEGGWWTNRDRTDILKGGTNRGISTAAVLHNAKKDWLCYAISSSSMGRAFSMGSLLREAEKRASTSTPKIENTMHKYNRPFRKKSPSLSHERPIYKSNTPDFNKPDYPQTIKTSTQICSPEKQHNRLIPRLKLRIRLQPKKEIKKTYQPPQQEAKKPNTSRPKFSEVVFAETNSDTNSEDSQKDPPIEIKKYRWYDYRPRLIINHYYRKNFLPSYATKKPIPGNKLTMAQIWQSALENAGNKGNEQVPIKGFDKARFTDEKVLEELEKERYSVRHLLHKERNKTTAKENFRIRRETHIKKYNNK